MNQCPYCGKYLLEYEECNCGRRVPLKNLNTDPKSLSNLGKVILTAIIYPLIVLIIALIAASSNYAKERLLLLGSKFIFILLLVDFRKTKKPTLFPLH